MKRIVHPELLDTLPANDPRAQRSRQDLRRLNHWMHHHAIMADELHRTLNRRLPEQLTELGSGDGNFLLQVANRIKAKRDSGRSPSPLVKATLLDLKTSVTTTILADLHILGWQAETIMVDVFDWLPVAADSEVIIANLFLHHFEGGPLIELLRLISQRAKLFICLEPRRARWPLFCSQLVGAIGCNEVTRHDAPTSVRAGFSGQELSALWPAPHDWRLTEHPIGPFSHLFVAQKTS